MSVHNGRRYLGRAIESIQNQTFRDFEFLIVNDASTDGSGGVCRRYADSDSRIRVLSNSSTRGLAFSLNKAWSVSKGTYLARMDADDVSLHDRFEKEIEYLEDHPEIGLVGCFFREMDGEGTVSEVVSDFPTEPAVLQWRLFLENPIPHPCVMMRRSIFEQMGGYDERWSISQDYDFFVRSSRITRLSNVPEVLYHRRVHDGSVTCTRNEEQRLAALSISQGAIEFALEDRVSYPLVETIWDRTLSSCKSAVEVSAVLHRLCNHILSQPRWTADERRILCDFVTTKLFYYLRPHLQKPATWPLVARIARLSPTVMWRLAYGWSRRRVTELQRR